MTTLRGSAAFRKDKSFEALSSFQEGSAMSELRDACERTIKGDVRYRFVIDLKTL
jgi:hypothetical protein